MTEEDDKQVQEYGSFHDAYFKAVMGEAHNVKDLIHKHLPKDITSQFSSDLPELVSGSFVDEALSIHLSDMLYRVKLKAGSEAFVYTLIEHKSSPDALQSYIPDFLYELVDLGQIEDQDLANDPRLAALLMPMKYIFTPKIILELTKTTDNLLKLEKMDFQLFLSYLIHARNDIGREEVGKILNLLPSPEQEDIMAGLAQEFKDDWYSKGEADGKAELLTEQLEYCFGSLSKDVKDKVSSANADTLRVWSKNILKASSLDDIFKSNK